MAVDKNVGGGVDRNKIPKQDFVFPEDAPDGGFPIVKARDVEDAVNSWGRYKGSRSFSEFKSRLTAIAKRKGFSSSLPDSWKTASQEIEAGIEAYILLEGKFEPQIVQEPSQDNDNIMRVRMPFYVGGSVNRPAGFTKKLYFPAETLPSLVEEGNNQIAEGNLPLTVYARHKHAISGDHLPIGALRGLEQEGSVGYVTLEIAPTDPDGKNTQMLIRNKMLNAGSLRMAPGNYQLEQGKLNGEHVFVLAKGSRLSGYDMAPDGPAQPTYGITVLNQEARVEPLNTKLTRRRKLPDEITLEDVPKDVREAIERPLRAQVESITQERDSLLKDKNLRDRDDYLRNVSKKTKDPEAGFAAMVSLCNEAKAFDREEASAAITPILLQALEEATKPSAEPQKTAAEMVRELFVTRTPSGSSVTQEPSTDAEPTLAQEERAYLSTVGGLMAPED